MTTARIRPSSRTPETIRFCNDTDHSGGSTFNTRRETVANNGVRAGAFASLRALFPMRGYFEWTGKHAALIYPVSADKEGAQPMVVERDNRQMYGTRLERWDHASEWPLIVAAVLFFVSYAFQILASPSGALQDLSETVIWATWAIFAANYTVRLVIAEHRWRWFYRHLLDLAIVVLPMLRPLRLMRFLTILAIIQRGGQSILRGKVVIYTVGATLLTVVIAALAVFDAERHTGNIKSFGEAIWWAFVTITTVGYGDYYPETPNGRIVAVGLMIGGIALIGVVTATLASWIVDRVAEESATAPAATQQQVDDMRAEIAELKVLLMTRPASAT